MGRRRSYRTRTAPANRADGDQIEQCEQRLALSASLMGDLLLEALDIGDPQPNTQTEPDSLDLISQAQEVRQTQGLTGAGQTVAVIDSGIAWDHLALGGGFGPGYRVVAGWDFAENDPDPYDDGPAGYHGSHVSGLLAADSPELVGVAPGADLVGLRVFDDTGAGKLEWIESALQWVHANRDSLEHPITTVNLSVGAVLTGADQSEAEAMLGDELKQLREDGILVFAAAGNQFASDDPEDVMFPASNSSVVAVTALDDGGQLSDFAQREAGILATRGVGVLSAVPEHVFGWDGDNNDVASLNGTSLATPQVAGASMLIRESLARAGIEPTPEAVLQRLHESASWHVDPITGDSFHAVDLIKAVNVENVSDTISEFDGSDQSEEILLDLRNGAELHVNGLSYQLTSDTPGQAMLLDAGGGADQLRIVGSENAERLKLDAGDASGRLSTSEFEIQLRGFERVDFVGGGGADRATLFDSVGDDELESHADRSTLSGIGFQFQISGIPRVYVHAVAGGSDTAYLHDSPNDDSLSVRPQFTSLRSDNTFQLAYGFERVHAYAGAGGFDSAEIYDSAGDDTMNVSANRSMISADGYFVSARGFASTIGHATAGGNDLVQIYAHASSQWHVTSDMVHWGGVDEPTRVARGFERVDAFQRAEAFERFEQVDLSVDLADVSSVMISHKPDNQASLEADAARAVFDALGQ